MIEVHPFGIFVPANAKYLMLGSFTGKETYDWYYGTKRNQIWRILEGAFNRTLVTKEEKQRLFADMRMAIGDIILQCERQKNSNLDVNLVNIVYNNDDIDRVLKANKIKTIFFTSKFVENKFRSNFKAVIANNSPLELVTLPSPSPRYAAMRLPEKIAKYKELLPKLV